MGGNLTKEQVAHLKELGRIVESSKSILQNKHCYPSKRDLINLLKLIWHECPSYPHRGSLDIKIWVKLGEHFHRSPRAPPDILMTWKGVTMALRSHFKDGMGDLPTDNDISKLEAFPNSQNETPPKYEDISQTNNPPSSAPIIQRHEEEKVESTCLKTKLGALEAGIAAAKLDPRTTSEDWETLSAFPIDFSGANPRYEELPFAQLKEIKSAIANHGLTSPYTQGLLENLNTNYILTPNEWRAVAKMFLSITQALLWNTAFDEACRDIQRKNVTHPLDRVMGWGNYASRAQQLTIPQATLLLITSLMTSLSNA